MDAVEDAHVTMAHGDCLVLGGEMHGVPEAPGESKLHTISHTYFKRI